MMASMPEGYTTDPMETVLAEGPEHARIGRVPIRAYLDRLRETGREDKVDAIIARHPAIGG
jgi:hypothetical protein